MSTISLRELLEARAQLGYHASNWNPKMAPYIYTKQNGVYIIDLVKTVKRLTRLCARLKEGRRSSERILFVGTKPQVATILAEEAKRCKCNYVNKRWRGGLLTNWVTSQKRLRYLKMLDSHIENNSIDSLPKKEGAKLRRKYDKLCQSIGGIRNMTQLPELVIIVDPKRERMAVSECVELNIPIIAILDTNCDPTHIRVPIPANHDSRKSNKIILSAIADAISSGNRQSGPKKN